MDTTTASNLLVQSLQDLCNEFNGKTIMPLLEADIVSFLYHRLILNGIPPLLLYNETRVCRISGKKWKYDIVIGDVKTEKGCVEPALIVQAKFFPRWGKVGAQRKRSFEEILFNDIPSMQTAEEVLPHGRVEVIADFYFTRQTCGYLAGTWSKIKRIKYVSEDCQEYGVTLIWVHPNSEGNLEIEQVV